MVWLKDAFPVCTDWFWISGGYVWLDAVGRCRYHAFPIVPGLSVMLTGVSRRPQGTCWSAPIFF